MIATAAAVAFVVFSCKSKLSVAEKLAMDETPFQIVDSMYVIQSKDGKLQMRIKAGVMERYHRDTMELELFPKGIEVYTYTEDGLLEATLEADNARHENRKNKSEELWMAFGNVRIHNIIKQETIETDTLYWDRAKGEIFNDCYVRLFSPDGFIQGYGLKSDDKARNSIILNPFNNYFMVVQDTTKVAIDSVNFIGPLLKK
ncbi:MAG: LPS export ABC transporter periplasmic protein LptC [Bacteroidales bacterium]|nr:LPS export ABC transporter periplasmic protein LptC [Bacteroidales bacterium]MDT3361397.1 LPS export ABC transporter periplasmic protein LptC [Bacteroidota bacterium]